MTDRSSYSNSLVQMLAEIERLRGVANQMLLASVHGVNLPPRPDDLPPEIAELADAMEKARLAMLQNPSAARALVKVLIAEGRRYAATPPGQVWELHINASPHLRYLRDLWEAVTLDVLDDIDETDAVPTAWIDLLSDALASQPDVETLLGVLYGSETIK